MPKLPAMLINWLLKPKNLMIIGAVGILAFASVQSWRVSRLKGDLTEANEQVAAITKDRNATLRSLRVCEAERTALRTSVDRQNAAVEALKADSDRRASQMDRALQAASEASRRANTAATRILDLKPKGDLCERMLAVEAAISKETP